MINVTTIKSVHIIYLAGYGLKQNRQQETQSLEIKKDTIWLNLATWILRFSIKSIHTGFRN